MTVTNTVSPARKPLGQANDKDRNSRAFAGLGSVLGAGFDASLCSDAADVILSLDQIHCRAQEREAFEDEDQTLQELGESLQVFQVQAILVRPVDSGPTPYELVAGERRLRAARLVGLTTLRAHIKPLTEQEAADARFAENIQRKNLTQVEEARRLQREVAELGVPATLLRHHKSPAWLSKRLALLDLPAQTQRLVTEAISADVELIGEVRKIEKASPAAAAQLVDELKATRGQQRARDQVEQTKRAVLPAKTKLKGAGVERTQPTSDRASPATTLSMAFDEISTGCGDAAAVLASLKIEVRQEIEQHLQEHYQAGCDAEDASSLVIRALREGVFGASGAAAYALAAFVQGTSAKPFSLHGVLNCATPALSGQRTGDKP